MQLMRRLFYKWKVFLAMKLKIKRCFVSNEQKIIRSGMGHIRRYEGLAFMKRGFAVWLGFVVCSRKNERAIAWRKRKLLRRVFVLYRERVRRQIDYRRSNEISSTQLKQIEAFVSSIDTKRSSEKHQEYLKRMTILASSEKDKFNRVCEDERRQKAIQKQIDADILLQQREQRRVRLQCDLKQLDNVFKSQWAFKEASIISTHESAIEKWISSAEFKDLSLKKEKEMMRVMALGSRVTNEQELALTNRSFIAYSILDSQLASANVCMDEFIHCFSSDTISFDQFETALGSCNILIDAEHIQGIFHDLCCNSMTTESSKTEELGLKDLNEYRQLASKLYPDGATWKFYICPYKQKLLFHHSARNEKIYESAATKKHVRKIVRENLRSVEMMKIRRNLFHEKCKAHELAIRNYRAKQLQSMYRRWRGRHRNKRRRKLEDDVPCRLSVQDCVTISISSYDDT